MSANTRVGPLEWMLWASMLVSAVVIPCVAQAPRDPFRKELLGYELYSWPDGGHSFNFCILPNSNADRKIEEVLDSKTTLHGTKELKRKIAEMPAGARLFWNDRIPWGKGPRAKGSERLAYPPPEVREQIRQYAKRHHVEIQILNPLFNP